MNKIKEIAAYVRNNRVCDMLRERVVDLLDRYESGDDGWLSEYDVQEELEEILDEEEYDEELSPKLWDAIDEFILARHHAERGGGRIPDGGDEFIQKIEQLCTNGS